MDCDLTWHIIEALGSIPKGDENHMRNGDRIWIKRLEFSVQFLDPIPQEAEIVWKIARKRVNNLPYFNVDWNAVHADFRNSPAGNMPYSVPEMQFLRDFKILR